MSDDWISVLDDDIPFDNEIVKCKYISKEFEGYCIVASVEILGRMASILKWYNRDGEPVPVGFWRRDGSIEVSRYDLLDLED